MTSWNLSINAWPLARSRSTCRSGAIGLRRPVVVAGGRDAAARALAVSGLIFVGPLALLFPESLAARIGPAGTKHVWLILIAMYALYLTLVLLTLRPRLVIYNISAHQLRPILAELVQRIDPEARWAGESLCLPGLGVQLHLDGLGWMRTVSLVSSGPKQDYQGWSRLEAELTAALRGVEPRGASAAWSCSPPAICWSSGLPGPSCRTAGDC